jgi:ribosome-associated translation inhibitor RaiA
MKRFLAPLTIAFSLMILSCGESSTQQDSTGGKSMNEAAVPEMSDADKLFEEVMAYHDEAMPKIGKLRGYQTQAQAKIDSLAAKSDAASKTIKAEYEALLAGLKRADKGMMDWMDTFNPEPDVADEAELKAYYEAEKVKAKAMRDDIFSVLDSAIAKLGS